MGQKRDCSGQRLGEGNREKRGGMKRKKGRYKRKGERADPQKE
jgi:hypothetical protein